MGDCVVWTTSNGDLGSSVSQFICLSRGQVSWLRILC